MLLNMGATAILKPLALFLFVTRFWKKYRRANQCRVFNLWVHCGVPYLMYDHKGTVVHDEKTRGQIKDLLAALKLPPRNFIQVTYYPERNRLELSETRM